MKKAAVFSGGGARCVAQLGYISMLKKWGVEFDAFSG
ncbi:MAG: patatin-like phospholipase family protein, partial [Epsilonproteobacteria bacterium]|nr:patatin-like phospholipase family protein [Campylobacterota bacterium]